MYHRVTNLPQDPYMLAVSPENFSDHLSHLKKTCTVLSLEELIAALDQKRLPPRAVAVTFDDAYVDTYTQALPLMQAAGVPATVFVAPGQVGSQREFWWDNLERIFLLPKHLPEQLSIKIDNMPYAWMLTSQNDRERVRADIYDHVKPLDSSEREAVLDKLAVWANLHLEGRSQYYVVNREALSALAADPGITIGAHTINHVSLAHLPAVIQQQEIATSRAVLEDWLDKPVNTFAYPYGTADDYTQETARLVQACGLKIACTSVSGSIEHGANRFELNRCGVHNWPIDIFRKKMDGFFIHRASI
jgi:peptidoglycan/xylan/chitin deacetylase (PgdA/CDA1 family)